MVSTPIDTGFPEPFCKHRNTTLRHPDAKFGDDAVISDSGFTLPTRRSSHKYRHTLSFGSLADLEDQMDKHKLQKRRHSPPRIFSQASSSKASLPIVAEHVAPLEVAGAASPSSSSAGVPIIAIPKAPLHGRYGSVDSTVGSDSERSDWDAVERSPTTATTLDSHDGVVDMVGEEQERSKMGRFFGTLGRASRGSR